MSPREEKQPVTKYLASLRTPHTRVTYESALKKFFNVARDELDTVASKYIADVKKGKRDPVDDLIALSKLPLAPKSIRGYTAGTIDFLRASGIFFSEEQRYRLGKNGKHGAHAITRDEPLTLPLLKKILAHADVRSRALFLMLVSSGSRTHEVLDLDERDLDLDAEPARFWIRKSKTGQPRLAFISREAVEAIREYQKKKEWYIRRANLASKRLKTERNDDNRRLFPFSREIISYVWRVLLKSAEIEKVDRQTHRRTITPHSCRKFFLSQMKKEVPGEIVEALAGHAGYLSDAYRRYTEEELADYYLKGEHLVSLHGESKTVAELQKQIDELQRSHDIILEKWVGAQVDLDEIRETRKAGKK